MINRPDSFRKPAVPRPDTAPQRLLAPRAVRDVLTAAAAEFPERRDPDSRTQLLAAHSLLDIPAVATRLGVFQDGAPADRPEDTLTGIKTLFRRLSTGHKFALLTVTQLAAYLRSDSLLLFDEPEANLHPPLVAALLRSVLSLLDARRSYAIITTHSPLVVQETLSLHVRYMSRDANGTSISTPSTETFGEDLGAITRDVFGITSRSSDFTSVLRNLARHHGLAAIEALFPHGLSVQARSIVHAVQSRRRAG